MPRIVTPARILLAIIFESIAEVTALTVTVLNPVYPDPGVCVCYNVVGVTVNVWLFTGVTDPDTPSIETPDLILAAVIFESIADVTALTVTVLKPTYPVSGPYI